MSPHKSTTNVELLLCLYLIFTLLLKLKKHWSLMTKDLNSRMIHFKKNKYPPVSYYLHAFRLRRFMKNQHFNQPKPAVHIGSEALLCTSSRSSKTIHTEAFVLPNSGGKKHLLQQDTNHKSNSISKSNWNISCLLCGGCGRVVWCSAPAVFGIWSS